MKHIIIKLAVVVAFLAAVFVSLPTNSASAHTKCRVPLPFGGWTEGCPHIDVPATGEDSCLSVMTNEFYEFKITNDTGYKVTYFINDVRFVLSDGYYRNHEEQEAYGTNSCNIRYYPNPEIEFDNSLRSGFQSRTYKLGDDSYVFEKIQNGIDLYYQ